MHLSLLSSALFDLSDDFRLARCRARRAVGARQHLDGLVRGLVFAAMLLTPFALTFAPTAFGHSNHRTVEVRP